MITLNIFTIVNLIILSVLMGVRRVNTVANKVLAFIIVLPAFAFFINYLIVIGFIEKAPFLLGFNVSFLWAPFVLWYVKLMLKQEVKIRMRKIWHLIPMLLDIAFGIYVQAQPESYKIALIKDFVAYVFPWQIIALNAMMMVQIFGYLGYSAYLIFKYKDEMEQPEQAIKIKWLKQFIVLLLVLNVFLVFSYSFFTPVQVDYYVVPILYDIFYFWVVYKSFSSSGIFSDFTYNINIKEEVISRERYSGSLLQKEQVAQYKQELLSFISDQQPYTNPELTLGKLSSDTGVPQHYLSQIINQEFKKNFFDFINAYRIDRAKELMKDPSTRNLTLEAIGAQSGFGSPSAFYRAFKKHTGITPSNYLKS